MQDEGAQEDTGEGTGSGLRAQGEGGEKGEAAAGVWSYPLAWEERFLNLSFWANF